MSDFLNTVGEQIRKIRKSRSLTQERLAELSGLSFSYISDVERGQRNISLESLGKIIQALGIRPVQLFEDMNENVDQTVIRIETLNLLLSGRDANEIEFILNVTRDFLKTVDRTNR